MIRFNLECQIIGDDEVQNIPIWNQVIEKAFSELQVWQSNLSRDELYMLFAVRITK